MKERETLTFEEGPSLHEWAVSRLMAELEKGEACGEADWIPEEDILREFNVTL